MLLRRCNIVLSELAGKGVMKCVFYVDRYLLLEKTSQFRGLWSIALRGKTESGDVSPKQRGMIREFLKTRFQDFPVQTTLIKTDIAPIWLDYS